MKKAFTLVELITVIVILGVLIAIIAPNIVGSTDKRRKEEWDKTVGIVELAAETYYLSHEEDYTLNVGDIIYIPAKELMGNELPGDFSFVNPVDNIDYKEYDVKIEKVSETESLVIEFPVSNTLVISIDANNVYSAEVKTSIPSLSGTVTGQSGTIPMTVDTSEININEVGKYNVYFKYKDASGKDQQIIKEFSVVDTTKPVITVNPKNVDYIIGNAFDAMTGVSVTDNYDTNITASSTIISGSISTSGPMIVRYTATDSNGNVATPVDRTYTIIYQSDTATLTLTCSSGSAASCSTSGTKNLPDFVSLNSVTTNYGSITNHSMNGSTLSVSVSNNGASYNNGSSSVSSTCSSSTVPIKTETSTNKQTGNITCSNTTVSRTYTCQNGIWYQTSAGGDANYCTNYRNSYCSTNYNNGTAVSVGENTPALINSGVDTCSPNGSTTTIKPHEWGITWTNTFYCNYTEITATYSCPYGGWPTSGVTAGTTCWYSHACTTTNYNYTWTITINYNSR